MKLSVFKSLLVVATLFQAPTAFSQFFELCINNSESEVCRASGKYRSDNNRPGRYPDPGGVRPDRPGHDGYWPTPPPIFDNKATVSFSNITRSSGGEWLRVVFNGSYYVDRVFFEVLSAGLVVHEAYVVTASRRRYSIPEFSRRGVLYAYSALASGYISVGEPVAAIDLRVESYGGYARMNVTVQSDDHRPSIYPYRP